MALGIYFMHGGFTPEKYSQTISRLADAGQGSPKGRTYHFALESEGMIQVFDVWESHDEFHAFGEVLMPILTDLGVDVGEPMVATIHNVIKG